MQWQARVDQRDRRLQQGDDGGFDLFLGLEGLEAQLLGQPVAELQVEGQFYMVWYWRWLGATGDSKSGCAKVSRTVQSRFLCAGASGSSGCS
jgi:hypothetical protein